jgi:hypothetical protein
MSATQTASAGGGSHPDLEGSGGVDDVRIRGSLKAAPVIEGEGGRLTGRGIRECKDKLSIG